MAETDEKKEEKGEESKEDRDKESTGVVGGILRGVSGIIGNILEIPGQIVSKTFKKRK